MIDKNWPSSTLLDIARNESASTEMRKAATELLMDSGAHQANHPELRALVYEIRAERAAKKEVVAIVEAANEQEIEAPILSRLAEAIGPLSYSEVDALIEQLKFAATQPILPSSEDLDAVTTEEVVRSETELQGLLGEIPPA